MNERYVRPEDVPLALSPDPELLNDGTGHYYYRPEAGTPEQAQQDIVEQWQDPTNRAMASIRNGELDTDHLALIVAEKIAEQRFSQAWHESLGMDESHPANHRLVIAQNARDAYERE